jgi:hypothetical protein
MVAALNYAYKYRQTTNIARDLELDFATMIDSADGVRFEVLTAVVMKSPVFWDIMPCSRHDRIRRTSKEHEAVSKKFILVPCLVYFSTLKTEATCSSETSVDFQWTIRCYIPVDMTLLDIIHYPIFI